MRPHKRGYHLYRLKAVQVPVDLQLFDLALSFQAVAALGFYRGRSPKKHPVQTFQGIAFEHFAGSQPGGLDRGAYSPAFGRDLLVRDAGGPHLKLVLP